MIISLSVQGLNSIKMLFFVLFLQEKLRPTRRTKLQHHCYYAKAKRQVQVPRRADVLSNQHVPIIRSVQRPEELARGAMARI